MFRIFKANQLTTYAPAGRVPVRVRLCRAAQGRALREDPDGSWGWERVTSLPVETLTVPGDHLSLLNEPVAGGLAQALT